MSDDYHAVAHASRGWGAIASDLTGPQFGAATIRFYRPVVTASLAANHALFGLEPEGYRWTNLLAHAVSVLLLFSLAREIGLGRTAALSAGALFAAFPYGPGAVAWVVGRVDSLCAPFALGTLCLHARARRKGKRWSPGSLVCLALALGTKEVAAALPFVLLALEYALPTGPPSLRRAAPSFALLAGYLLVRRAALGGWLGGYPLEVDARAVGSCLVGLAAAASRVVVPAAGGTLRAVLFLAFVATFLLLGGWRRGSRRIVLLGLSTWVLLSLPAGAALREPGNLPNLRVFYLPSSGLALAVASLVEERRRRGFLLLGPVLASMALGLGLSIRDHLAAGRNVEGIRAAVERASRACPAPPPLFVSGVPRTEGSAYVFHWGFGSATSPPFRRTGPLVRLLRPCLPQAPILEGMGIGGRCLLRLPGGGVEEEFVAPVRSLPRFEVESPALGRLLALHDIRSALDGDDFPIRFSPSPPGETLAVLFTSLGYNALPLPSPPGGLLRDVLRPPFAPGLTLSHTILQAFDAGDREFLLYFRADFPDGERETDLLPLRFAEDVPPAFWTLYAR